MPEREVVAAVQSLLDWGWVREINDVLTAVDGAVDLALGLSAIDISSCANLSGLPQETYMFERLTKLNLSDCGSLKVLSEEIAQLEKLEVLNLDGCTSLTALPNGIGQLKEMKDLDLSGCASLAALPKGIGQLKKLETLNLSGCASLSALPKEMAELEVLKNLFLSGCEELPLPHSAVWPCFSVKSREFNRWSAQERIQAIIAVQKQRSAVEELAKRQEPMVQTLQRMSLLMVLLATATFLAYLQPPGGYVIEEDWSMTRARHLISCEAGSHEWGTLKSRRCSMLLFFIFDGLAFGLCISCIMMIVVIALPRVAEENKRYEAGRFFLLLIVTWALLWLAVVSGFVAFLLSGLAVSGTWTVVGPLLPGMILLLTSLVLMVIRFYRLFPGRSAIYLALGVWCLCKTLPLESKDDGLGDLEAQHIKQKEGDKRAQLQTMFSILFPTSTGPLISKKDRYKI